MKLISGILAAVAMALVAVTCAHLSTLHAAGAAARALGEANCTGMLIAAWMLIGASFVYLTLHNEIPSAASLAALVLHPASGAAALSVVQLVSRSPNHQWMLAVPLLGASALASYVAYSLTSSR
ncbi:MAG: hypothetical protein HY820_02405 [Acidobacteria bacterium]|nr:hypothetical protein [Acidobacteriota bacterium]